jgi:hypothetical protein
MPKDIHPGDIAVFRMNNKTVAGYRVLIKYNIFKCIALLRKGDNENKLSIVLQKNIIGKAIAI